MEQGPERDRQRRDRVLSRDPKHASGRENRPREGGRMPPLTWPCTSAVVARASLLTSPRRLRDSAGEWTWAWRTPPWRLERGGSPDAPPMARAGCRPAGGGAHRGASGRRGKRAARRTAALARRVVRSTLAPLRHGASPPRPRRRAR